MTEHQNTQPGSSEPTVTGQIKQAIVLLGLDSQSGVRRGLAEVRDFVTDAQQMIRNAAVDGDSPLLADVQLVVDATIERLNIAAGEIAEGVGHLAIYSSALTSNSSTQQSVEADRTSRGERRGRHHGRRRGKYQDSQPTVPRVSIPEIHGAMRYTQHEFLKIVPYNNLAMECARAVRRGNTNALYVPAVQFVLDTVLAVVDQDIVASRLPLEVHERAAMAMNVATSVATLAVDGKMLDRFYKDNPYLSRLITPSLQQYLQNTNYISTLTGSVFSDVAFVSGGALRAIREKGGAANERKLIGESLSLKSVAGMGKGAIQQLCYDLGLPYPESDHYHVSTQGGVASSVDFNERVIARIQKNTKPGTGCPIRQLKSGEPPFRTEMDRAWNSAVKFLIPNEATILAPQVTVIYKDNEGRFIGK